MSDFLLKRDFGAWHVAHDFYGECESVEAVFYPKRENYYLGVGINLTYEGCYQLRISDMKQLDRRKHRLILMKSYCHNVVLKSIYLDFDALNINPKGPIKLKLTFTNGILEGYINDVPYIDYEDTDRRVFHTEGYGAVWIHPGRAADVENFDVKGISKPAPKGYQRPEKSDLHYQLDLENATENAAPPCWSTVPYAPQWLVKSGESGKTFSSEYTEETSQIHLHVFEDTPHVNADVSFNKFGENGEAGFLLRHAPETAYVRVGYNKALNKWFVEDVPAFYDCKSQQFYSDEFPLEPNATYNVDVLAEDDKVILKVDGKTVIEAKGMRQVEFGRLGLFAKESVLNVHSYKAHTPFATPAVDGVIKYVAEPDVSAASMGIVEAPDGTLVGVRKVLPAKDLLGSDGVPHDYAKRSVNRGILTSKDRGLSFELLYDGGEYADMCTNGKYVSMLRLKNGKYIQVHYFGEEFDVSESDDLKTWKKIGAVCKHCPDGYSFFHAQSLAEFTLPDGTNRLFLPIVHTTIFKGESASPVKPHDTVVYYSDDGGRTWEKSETATNDLILETDFADVPDYAETKLLMCSDNTLRLYCSRNHSRFLTYSESHDFGKTWQGLHSIRHMQCAKSSFSICEDPYEPGTCYLAWVNDKSFSRGNVSARTRFSLARSYDGKNWEFLCDLERFAVRIADDYPGIYIPLFQIVDPVVAVFDDYILVDSGVSARQSMDACIPGSTKAVHHEQRTCIIRLEKSKLKAQPWNEYSISDMSLLEDDGEAWL